MGLLYLYLLQIIKSLICDENAVFSVRQELGVNDYEHELQAHVKPCHGSGGYSPASQCRDPGSISGSTREKELRFNLVLGSQQNLR
jgi:hypothetical protein